MILTISMANSAYSDSILLFRKQDYNKIAENCSFLITNRGFHCHVISTVNFTVMLYLQLISLSCYIYS